MRVSLKGSVLWDGMGWTEGGRGLSGMNMKRGFGFTVSSRERRAWFDWVDCELEMRWIEGG